MTIGISQTPKLQSAAAKLETAFQNQTFSSIIIDINQKNWQSKLEEIDVFVLLINESLMSILSRENWQFLLDLKQKEQLEIVAVQVGNSNWNYSPYADKLMTFPLDKSLLTELNVNKTVLEIKDLLNGNLIINKKAVEKNKAISKSTFNDDDRQEQYLIDLKGKIEAAKLEQKWQITIELYQDLIHLSADNEKAIYEQELKEINTKLKADKLILQGRKLFTKGHSAEALSKFEAAYALNPHEKLRQSILKIKSKQRHQKVKVKEQKDSRTKLYIVLVTIVIATLIGGLIYYLNLPEPINTEIIVDVENVPAYEMVLVEGGTFSMGKKGEPDQEPVHKVTLTPFYIGKYEVTVEQFDLYCQEQNIDFYKLPFGRGKLPMVKVSWINALEYANWLSKRDGYSAVYLIINEYEVLIDENANGYRLPTEAQWEFAARGGNKMTNTLYAGDNTIRNVSWYSENAGNKSQEVGTKQPNELGIYDMSGNVWEWCWDWYGERAYGYHEKTNPQGMGNGTNRCLRGGSWYTPDYYLEVKNRSNTLPLSKDPDLGFRLVRMK